ncbi:threonine aldolase family protein [Aureimonas altamirensis]|uniref:threonine aldolase family protein n=1 Tax=Aureimonas altamirensis TaxID=370622 RepID=UPI002556115A|nr:low specificity L-threonine aldolase [Aureimonas altamirensis]
MIFSSDNWSGAHPAISASLARHAEGMAAAYGSSPLDTEVARRFDALFEREVAVFYVGTGTAANSLALSAFNRPGGVVLCHSEAHIMVDECGAPEFFAHGSRLAPVAGPGGMMEPAALKQALEGFDPAFVHGGRPVAVSISQSAESGALYAPATVGEIASIAHGHGLAVHMDGARFANAVAALGISPAEASWKAGVDVMSFGGTKNGCWCAEAIVFFDPDKAADFVFNHKRAGQLFSKSRFVSAQFDAYLADNLWLSLASHANAMADGLRRGIETADNARSAWPTAANEVFAVLKRDAADRARAEGALFYDWHVGGDTPVGDDEVLVRLVASWSTSPEEVENFIRLIG